MKIGILLPAGISMCGGMRGTIEIANRLNARKNEVILYWMGEPAKNLWEHLSTDCKQVMGTGFDPSLDALIATEWRTAKPVLDADISSKKFYWLQHRESLWCGQGAEDTYDYPLIPITVCHWLADLMRSKGHKEVYTITPGFWHGLFWQVERENYRPRILMEGSFGLEIKGCSEGWRAMQNVNAERWVLSLSGYPKDADKVFSNPPQDKLRWIYSQCDVLLKPSRIEAFPMPPAEAMACGCVPVVCDVPGMDEYCVDGENCLKVPVSDEKAMTDAINRLLYYPELRNYLRIGGLETVFKPEFDWEGQIDKWEEVLANPVS